MFQRFAILITAMLMLLGCSLTSEVTKTAVPSATPLPLPTQPSLPTVTPTPFSTATPTTAPSSTPIPVANRPCTARTDWPVYIVVAGDTLADIARRSASTVNELATANCLSNANNIFAGQRLYVPRVPTPPTPLPVPTSMDNNPRILTFRLVREANPPRLEWYTSNVSSVLLSVSGPRGAYIGYGAYPANGSFVLPEYGMDFAPVATFTLTMRDLAGRDVLGPNGQPVTARLDVEIGDAPLDCPTLTNSGSGDITVSPVLGMVDRCSYVRPNQTLWVTWEGVSGLTSAEYYFLPSAGTACGTPGNANVIGVDQNIADGNLVTWYIGAGPCAGTLYAFGYNAETLVESRQHALVVYSR